MTQFGLSGVVKLALTTLLLAGSARAEAPAPGSARDPSNAGSGGAMASDPSAARGAATAAAATGTASQQGEVVGRVERIDRAGNMTVAGSEREGLAFEEFKVDDGTQISVGGEKASITQINEGDQVRASFSGPPEDRRVQKLEILPSTGASRMNTQPPTTGERSAPPAATSGAREPAPLPGAQPAPQDVQRQR